MSSHPMDLGLCENLLLLLLCSVYVAVIIHLSFAKQKVVTDSVGTVTETGTETALFWQNRTEAKPRF